MQNRLPVAIVAALFVFPAMSYAQAAEWTIDPVHSSVQFSVRHMLISTVRGQADGPRGTVRFDPSNLAATQVEATIAARSITTHNEARDKDLHSDDFFDVEKFPRITFKSTRAVVNTPRSFRLVGDLTMHGITKSVTLNVEGPSAEIVDLKGDRRIAASATTTIDRREFGLLYNELLEGGGAVVSNDVTITLDLEMTRKK